MKLMHCPSCGGEYFLVGKKEAFTAPDPITCPDCGTVCEFDSLKLGEAARTEQLKPCPFCGGEAEIHTETTDGYRHFWICCENGCAYTMHLPNLFTVKKRWNRRTPHA